MVKDNLEVVWKPAHQVKLLVQDSKTTRKSGQQPIR